MWAIGAHRFKRLFSKKRERIFSANSKVTKSTKNEMNEIKINVSVLSV